MYYVAKFDCKNCAEISHLSTMAKLFTTTVVENVAFKENDEEEQGFRKSRSPLQNSFCVINKFTSSL